MRFNAIHDHREGKQRLGGEGHAGREALLRKWPRITRSYMEPTCCLMPLGCSRPRRAGGSMVCWSVRAALCAGLPARAVASLVEHQPELLTYYDFPREHWKSLRTSNPIESVFDPVRLRTRATRRMRTARTGLYLVFQLVATRESGQALDGHRRGGRTC